MKRRIIIFTILLFFLQNFVFAQTSGSGKESGTYLTLIFLVLSVAFLLYVLIALEGSVDIFAGLFQRVVHYIFPPKDETLNVEDIGHSYDGIKELNNRVPPWFNYLFLGTIVFGIIYFVDYHVLKVSPLMLSEYQKEIDDAATQRQILSASEPPIDETKLTALHDEASIKKGEEIFKKYCVSCHGDNGQGLVGPNLTDQYWIHGGGIKNVYATIKNGVPAKGMISWQLVLTGKQIQEAGSYVLSLQGSNPAGAKPPQGEKWNETETASTTTQAVK